MVFAFSALLAIGYWLGGRLPLRVVNAQRHWTARHWRALAFGAGLAIVTIALADPIDRELAQTLYLRTAQLLLLAMVACPLIVVGAPLPRWKRLFGLPARGARRSALPGAIAAFIAFNGALLMWFLPTIVDGTESLTWARQVALLLIVLLGIAFWSEVIAQPPARCTLSHLRRIVYLFLSSAVLRVLGLVLGFATARYYAVSLSDQQIAAGILLVPGVLTDLIVLTVCLYLWLGQDDRAASRSISGGSRHRALG